MDRKNKMYSVTKNIIKRANSKLMAHGVKDRGERSANAGIVVSWERDGQSHKKELTYDEIKKAYRKALKANGICV